MRHLKRDYASLNELRAQHSDGSVLQKLLSLAKKTRTNKLFYSNVNLCFKQKIRHLLQPEGL